MRKRIIFREFLLNSCLTLSYKIFLWDFVQLVSAISRTAVDVGSIG